ncbi:MAG: acyltransferase family protein [Caldilineales bacterium]|nr:acyltransferase family protein [Caldilineales bacterium]
MTPLNPTTSSSAPNIVPQPASKVRLYELDWLRVLAILAVFLFHSMHFFDTGDWHVKNGVVHPGLDLLATILLVWMMPLIFLVSGASTFFALGKHPGREFLKDRTLRLMVPLVFGIFTHIMWQVYLERVTHHQFVGSFLQFIPYYFNGLYALGGNFAWMGLHLWYLLMLWVFSVLFLPLFLWWRQGSGRAMFAWLGNVLALPGVVYLLALPISILLIVGNPSRLDGARVWGGWSLLGYLPIFLNGFLVVSDDRLYDRVRRLRWVSLALALSLIFGLLVIYLQRGDPVYHTPYYSLLNGLYGIDAWLGLLAILGFAAQRLRFPKPVLAYANEAVLPFYVMHQTVLLTVGYVVVRWAISDLLKWAIIAGVSFTICLLLFEYLIRRHNVLRFLFGMKPLSRPVTAATPAPIPAS